MTTGRRPRRLGAVLAVSLAVVLGGSACGNDDKDVGTTGKAIEALDSPGIPTEILGLAVTKEDMGEALTQVDRAYLDAFALYSMRTGELLEATLQISRFTPDTELDDDFRAQLVQQVGSAKAEEFKMGEHTVYLTRATKQQIALWFRDRDMFVLAIRDDFELPRALLRNALEIKA